MKSTGTKTLLALLLVCSMTLGAAACALAAVDPNVSTDGYLPICREPITITATGLLTAGADWNNLDLIDYLEEKMGIRIESTPYDSSAWPTQFTLMLTADELPDIVFKADQDINAINKYGQDGYFLSLNEYLDCMPAFSAFLEAHPDYRSVITASDGNIYGLTQYNENRIGRLRRTFINRVWLDNVGMDMPQTVDQLYAVLQAFRDQDANGNGDPGDEIPFSSGFDMMVPLLHAFGILSNGMDYAPMADENGHVILGQATENYKALLTFMKRLYDEGLYDKDGLVQTGAELNAKIGEDRVGMFGTWSAPYVAAKQPIEYDANWLWVDGLTSACSDVPAAVYNSAVGTNVKIMVNANTRYPEAICRLIDWLYTDEGTIMASRGVEGVGFEWVDVEYLDNVKITMARNNDPETYTSPEEYRYKKGVINEGMNVRALYPSTMYEVLGRMSDEDLARDELLKNQGWACLMERGLRKMTAVDAFPSLVYTDEEADRRSTLTTDIKMYIRQAYGQFIIGELDIDADWDAYLNTLNQIGLEELMAIEQAAYDRR